MCKSFVKAEDVKTAKKPKKGKAAANRVSARVRSSRRTRAAAKRALTEITVSGELIDSTFEAVLRDDMAREDDDFLGDEEECQ